MSTWSTRPSASSRSPPWSRPPAARRPPRSCACPATRPELVKPVLDCGALGVVFPQIATRAEAEATVQAVRYAPAGRRGYGPTYAALRWGLPNLEYLKAANEAVLNVVLIESLAGVDALDEILNVRRPRRRRGGARRSVGEPGRGRPVRPSAPARGRGAGRGEDPRPRRRGARRHRVLGRRGARDDRARLPVRRAGQRRRPDRGRRAAHGAVHPS